MQPAEYERTEGQRRRQQTAKQTIFLYKDKLEKQAVSVYTHHLEYLKIPKLEFLVKLQN